MDDNLDRDVPRGVIVRSAGFHSLGNLGSSTERSSENAFDGPPSATTAPAESWGESAW